MDENSNLPVLAGDRIEKALKFWETKPGLVWMGAGAIALVAALYAALPYLIHLFGMGVQLMGLIITVAVLAVAAIGLYMLLSNKRFWAAITVRLDNLTRKMMHAVIEDDPIGSAKGALSRMQARIEVWRVKRQAVLANAKQVQAAILKSQDELQEEREIATQAAKANDQGAFDLHTSTIADLEDSVKDLEPVAAQIKYYSDLLGQVISASELKLAKFSRKLQIKERDLAAKQAGADAARSYREAQTGMDAEVLAESMEVIGSQIAQAESEMTTFEEDVIPEIMAGNLKQKAQSARGTASLQRWLQTQGSGGALLDSGTARGLLQAGGGQPVAVPVQGDPAKVATFDKFFTDTK